MSQQNAVPEGEALRRALAWLVEQRRHDAAAIGEASRRFDLSPLDEAFLRRHFGPRGPAGLGTRED